MKVGWGGGGRGVEGTGEVGVKRFKEFGAKGIGEWRVKLMKYLRKGG